MERICSSAAESCPNSLGDICARSHNSYAGPLGAHLLGSNRGPGLLSH
jgi:hypothetical protein